jgi:hypothetical protein
MVDSFQRLPAHGCKLRAHQIASNNTDTEITIRVMYFNHKRLPALDPASRGAVGPYPHPIPKVAEVKGWACIRSRLWVCLMRIYSPAARSAKPKVKLQTNFSHVGLGPDGAAYFVLLPTRTRYQ